MKLCPAVVLCTFAMTGAAHAQLGIYGGFSTATLKTANSSRLYGGTVGAYFDGSHHPLVNFGVDLRATFLPEKNSTSITAVTAGPRLVVHLPVVPLRPYAELLVGGAHAKTGQGFTFQDRTSVAAGAAVGADLRILPFIDWRVLDYSYTRVQAVPTYQQTLTTGIVIRIPFS